MNESAVALSESTVALFPQQADGTADYAHPLWLGAKAHGGSIRTAHAVRMRHPTGRVTPVPVTAAGPTTVTLESVWVVRHAEPAADAAPVPGRYVLLLDWRDARTRVWQRSTFYDVAWQEAGWTAQGYYSFAHEQTFVAGRRVSTGGPGLWVTPHWRETDDATELLNVSTGQFHPVAWLHDPPALVIGEPLS